MAIVVEANVTERQPHREIVQIPFEFPLRDATQKTLERFDEVMRELRRSRQVSSPTAR